MLYLQSIQYLLAKGIFMSHIIRNTLATYFMNSFNLRANECNYLRKITFQSGEKMMMQAFKTTLLVCFSQIGGNLIYQVTEKSLFSRGKKHQKA